MVRGLVVIAAVAALGCGSAAAEAVDVWYALNQASWKALAGWKIEQRFFPFGTFAESEADCEEIQRNIQGYDAFVGSVVGPALGMFDVKATGGLCGHGVILGRWELDELHEALGDLAEDNARLRRKKTRLETELLQCRQD